MHPALPSWFGESIALAQQQFHELLALQPLDLLQAGNVGEGPKRARVTALLDSLSTITSRVQGLLATQLRESRESPILSLPPTHARFLRTELLPNAKTIHRALLRSDELGDLIETWLDEFDDRDNHPIKNALWFAVEYADVMLEEVDDRRYPIEFVRGVLEEGWFQPDSWRESMRLLRPVLVGRTEVAIPMRVRVRIAEVHCAFTFGAWMAAIAMCRALAEFAIVERAPNIGITATWVDKKGVERYKRLDDLIDLVAEKRSELRPALKVLQDAGNRILHPRKKQNVVPTPRVLRSEALDCVQQSQTLIEELYAE